MKQLDDKELFGSKFQDFGAAPSDAVWKGIEAAMPQEKKKKRGAFWWWSTGLAASLLLCYGIYSGVQSMNSTHNDSRSASTVNPSMSEKNPKSSSPSAQQHSTNRFTNSQPSLNKNNAIKTTKMDFALPSDSSFSTLPKTDAKLALKAKKGLKLPLPSIQHFQPTTLSDSNSLADEKPTVAPRQRKTWRIGAGVEQTERFEIYKTLYAPTVIEPSNIAPNYVYDWYRSRSIYLDAEVDLSRSFTFGTGLEYTKWDNLKKAEGNLLPSRGKAFGVPLRFTYYVFPGNKLRVGFQLDVRNRYFYQQSDTIYPQPISAGVNYYLLDSYGTTGIQKIQGFQQQYGLGLVVHWNITPYLGWNTAVEIQSSGWRSNTLQSRLSGNWIGIKSGIYYQF